jgi:hypothetical protein
VPALLGRRNRSSPQADFALSVISNLNDVAVFSRIAPPRNHLSAEIEVSIPRFCFVAMFCGIQRVVAASSFPWAGSAKKRS